MPKLNAADDLEQFKLPGAFTFSATKIESLGADEYTLITVAVDDSGSINSFRSDMINCMEEIVKACRYSPRADNLLIRVTTFSSALKEFHGFKPLMTINAGDYANLLGDGGMTALYDACVNAVEATAAYGKSLNAQHFSANGIVIVITDGMNNSSNYGKDRIKEALVSMMKEESLESIVSILVGVNMSDSQVANELRTLQQDAGFTQFVEIKDATKSSIAKLAQFVSKSISAQSQALGTGGPSQSISI